MGFLTSRCLRSGSGAILVFLGAFLLGGCDRDEPTVEAPAGQSAAAQSVAYLPFDASAFALLVDDVDGNGHLDVALTSHQANFTQVFFQQSPRTFEPGSRVEAVGFHPGELHRLPGAERRYLMFSEGINRLQVMTPREDGGLEVVAALNVPTPRVGTAFHWPGWGLGVAVAPFGDPSVYLLKGFDTETAEAASVYRVPYKPRIARVHNMAAADLDEDEAEELLFINSVRNSLSVIRRPEEGEPLQIEDLWHFDRDRRVGLLVPADIDQDGDSDLIVPDRTEGRTDRATLVHVLANNGSGAFEHRKVVFPGRSRADGGMTGIRALATAADRDTKTYLLAVGYEQIVLMRFPPGWVGGQPEIRTVALPQRDAASVALLRDLDGDGWLDAIVARMGDDNGALIIYGPLWEQFDELSAEDLARPE